MLAIPHVGGGECVAVLERLGWSVRERSRGLVTLCRDGRAVVVPEIATLGPGAVSAILDSTQIEPLEFLRVLAALPPAA